MSGPMQTFPSGGLPLRAGRSSRRCGPIAARSRERTLDKPMYRRLKAYRIEFFRVRPALKRTDLDALIFMASPVRGFTPLRAARFATVKVPKPAN